MDPAVIHSLRMRKEKELAAEAAGKKRHVKSGYGGLLDIQMVASFLLFEKRLSVPNTLEALAEIEKNELLSAGKAGLCKRSGFSCLLWKVLSV